MTGRAAVPPSAPPSGNRSRIETFRRGLDAAGFDAAAVRGLLHADTELLARPGEAPVYERRLAAAAPALAVLIRLFVLDLPVDAAVAEPALGTETLAALNELGLTEDAGGRLAARVRLVPHDDLLIASDCVSATMPDHVAAVHRPSATLAGLTMRRPVATALDVGTGNGIQALLLATHSDRVVATDVNERALAFAEFNAALNGRSNIEVRAGSFLEPVRGEQFELIVCNPPYVISPESELVFRDSGLPGDSVSEQLVRAIPEYMTEGGFATVMLSWIAGDDVTARPRSWLESTGCDAWLVHTGTDDPLTAAASWNRSGPAEVYAARIAAWLEYYASLGIEALAYGAAVLRRREGGDTWVRAAELPVNRLWPASEHLERLFAAQELLASDVLDRPLAVVPAAFVDRTSRLEGGDWRSAGATIRLESGIGFGVNLDVYGSALVETLDGSAPVRERIRPLSAKLGVPEQELTVFADALVRHLVERGFVC